MIPHGHVGVHVEGRGRRRRLVPGGSGAVALDRALPVLLGAALLTFGWHRGGVFGGAIAFIGLGIAGGIDAQGAGAVAPPARDREVLAVTLADTVRVACPPDRLHHLWRRRMGRTVGFPWRRHRRVGLDLIWAARIIDDRPCPGHGRRLSWRLARRLGLDSWGFVEFRPAEGGTDLHVTLRYVPPGGRLMAVLSKLSGRDPQHRLAMQLRALAAALGTGTAGGAVGHARPGDGAGGNKSLQSLGISRWPTSRPGSDFG